MCDLHKAAREGNLDEVERILAIPDGKAPDPNDRDNLGRTAMHLAAWAGHAKVVRRLAEAKGDPSARAGSEEVVKELLAANADVHNIDRKKKNTPLHVACEKGHKSIITLLVQAGANTKARNKANKLPFDVCPNDETRFALPGSYSKLKGDRASWKERDPEAFQQAMAELSEKKAATKALKPSRRQVPAAASDATAAGDAAGEETQEPQDESESPFVVPQSKRPEGSKSKGKLRAGGDSVEEPAAPAAGDAAAAGKHPRTDDEDGDAGGGGQEAKRRQTGAPAAGGGGRGHGEEGGEEAQPDPNSVQAHMQGLRTSRDQLMEMLEEDPENEELLAMKAQLDEALYQLTTSF